VGVVFNENGMAKSSHGGTATVTPGGVSCSGQAKAKLRGGPGPKTQKC
jgi:hypothetical protein